MRIPDYKYCFQEILWMTRNGKNIPLNQDYSDHKPVCIPHQTPSQVYTPKESEKSPDLKEESITEKESELSASVEVQDESHNEIKKDSVIAINQEQKERIYRFTINYIPNYFEKSKQIKSEKLVEAILEHFFIDEKQAEYIANSAIKEYREATKTDPQFRTVYQEIYNTEEKKSLKPTQSQKPKFEDKKTLEVKQVSTLKMRLNHDVKDQDKIKLDDRDKKIIFQFSIAKVASYVLQYLDIPKATFYRKIKKLTDLGILVKLEENRFSRYVVSPRFKKGLEMRLMVGGQSSPKMQSTSKTASFEEPTNESQDSSFDCNLGEALNSSKSPIPRENNETRYDITNKNLSFEELIKLFDPHNLRSHSYLFSVEIINLPTNYFKMLEKESNWLECHEGMKNWIWFSGNLKFYNINVVVRFHTKKITIRIIEIWGTDSFINDSIADDIVLRTLAIITEKYHLELGEIEKIYGEQVKKRLKIKVMGTHHALPFHPIAIKAMQENLHIKTKYWEVDRSKGKPELEGIHNNSASENVQNYVKKCLDYMAEKNRWIDDIDNDIKEIKETQEVLFENLTITTNNLEKISATTNQKLEEINQSLNKNKISIHSLIQKIDNYSDEIQSIQQSAFANQQFQNNLLSTIDYLLSILVDIKENFTETNLFQSRNIQSHENHVSRQERNIDKTTVQVLIKLSSRQAQSLDIIRENPGLTRRKISERFGIKRGYANGTVPRLKKHHLIKEKENRKLFIIS